MNRVLSFPQSQTCDSPSEVVSKRFCFSCIFSISFVSVILGYLLGSRQSSAPVRPHVLDHNRIFFEINVTNADLLRKLKLPNNDANTSYGNALITNYEEAVLLQQHFEKYKFDEISPVTTSNILLTFKNKDTPDALEIVDRGELRYRNTRNAKYSYIIPDDAKEISNVTSRVSGLPVYGNYGTQDDLNYLTEKGISLRGCVILLRLGKIPISEKVTAALKRDVNAVLLFADPQQYPYGDNLTVTEEISPTLLANLQKLYNSLGTRQQNITSLNNGVPVQIIEAMTAQIILREMALTNKCPDSWLGSLNALYSIGPGFVFPGKLVLYSYFINVNYTTYDIAAYLKGSHEHDRYIIVGSRRRTLINGENVSESTNTFKEVSKTLSELKINKGWSPRRTIVFCSFGLEEAEIYSDDSWVQRNKHLIKQRAVSYLDIKSTHGLEYLNVRSSPPLIDLFERISTFVQNPNAEERLGEKKSLFDVWRLQKKFIYSDYRQKILHDENNLTRSQMHMEVAPLAPEIENRLFEAFEIPILSVAYTNEDNKSISNKSTNDAVNIFEYENAIAQLWTLITFSFANSLLMPFNISAYGSILNNFYEKLYLENEKRLENTDLIISFKHFGELVKKMASDISTFQNNSKIFDDYKLLQLRILNDKSMQIYRLLRCDGLTEDDKFTAPAENQFPVFLSLQEALQEAHLNSDVCRAALKKTVNCMNEINFLLDELKTKS